MIRAFCKRGILLANSFRRTGKGRPAAPRVEPFPPRRSTFSYLWFSLHFRRVLLLLSRFKRWGDGDWRKREQLGSILGFPVQAAMEHLGLGHLKHLKLTVLTLGLMNLAIVTVAVAVACLAASADCTHNVLIGAAIMAWGAGSRLVWMIGMAFTQAGFASIMIAVDATGVSPGDPLPAIAIRRKRQLWYKRWLWWSRVGTIITLIQILGTAYFSWFFARAVSIHDGHLTICGTGEGHVRDRWAMLLMLGLPTLGCIIVLAQCCVGSDVLAWRLLYGAHDDAWRAHYRQIFDYGIREVLCCLGRRRYMSVHEADEVDSVATLLGDLVAYRAAGASHLEVIAGVALLREAGAKAIPVNELQPAPPPLLAEATVLHPFAEAAYTGPLLDVGRNPLTFPFAWLYRQGVLTPWTWKRRVALEGDNWWRGHAAAFLGHAQLPSDALRQGRVLQTNRESAYFVAVLHKLHVVLVAVRGTETPEDLITDGLGTECALTTADLQGILKNRTISDRVKQEVLATMPHFGHVGVIEAARELALQLDDMADEEEIEQHDDAPSATNSGSNIPYSNGCRESTSPKKTGLLSSLLGPGCECEGYSLRFVGHSLGGAIAALTGLRLASRYQTLHVYAFGVLPCLDLSTAEACSTFTTSLIYNDEFSSRLSVAAVMRLRAAAIQAVANKSTTGGALVTKLTRRLFKYTSQVDVEAGNSSGGSVQTRQRFSDALKGPEISDEEEAVGLMNRSQTDRVGQAGNGDDNVQAVCDLLENGMPKDMPGLTFPGSNVQELWPAELFVPGLVVHLTRTGGESKWFNLPRSLGLGRSPITPTALQHQAVLRDRKYFRDIMISPTMFVDHMPWKCQYALNDIVARMDSVNGQDCSSAESVGSP